MANKVRKTLKMFNFIKNSVCDSKRLHITKAVQGKVLNKNNELYL